LGLYLNQQVAIKIFETKENTKKPMPKQQPKTKKDTIVKKENIDEIL